MKSTVLVASAFAAALLSALGCGEPTAPNATESVPVSVQLRTSVQGESVPGIHVAYASGSLAIRVTREAMCAPIISAAVRRRSGEVSLVSRVTGNPLANCTPFQPNHVIDYTGTVNALAVGTYRVRVFEALGEGDPKYLGAVSVTVSAPPA